jgi:hypothetical protein
MSVSSLFNSPTYGQTYTLTSFDSSLEMDTSADLINFNIRAMIVTTANGIIYKYITLPAGKYLATMSACITLRGNTAADQVVNYAQLQIVSNANVLYGASTAYNKNLLRTLANTATSALAINESVIIELTAETQLSLRMVYNSTGNADALTTKDTSIGLNPVFQCLNQIVFKEIL